MNEDYEEQIKKNGGYNLNGIYYSRDGVPLGEKTKPGNTVRTEKQRTEWKRNQTKRIQTKRTKTRRRPRLYVTVFLILFGISVFSEILRLRDAVQETGSSVVEQLQRTVLRSDGNLQATGEYVPYVEGFADFEMYGTAFSIPTSMDTFTEAGFVLSYSEPDERIEPGSYNGYALYSPTEVYVGTIFLYNKEDTAISPEEGTAGGIVINAGVAEDLKLAGGLTASAEPEDLAEALGNELTEISGGETYTSYQWYFADAGYSTSIQFQYEQDGALDEVWIMNNASLR